LDRQVPIWEKAFAVLTLFAAARGLLPLYYGGGEEDAMALADSNLWRLLALLSLYSLAALLLMRRHFDELAALLAQNKLLLLTLGVVLASSLWSVDPGTTFRRGVALAMTAVFCAYLALRFTPVEIVRLAAIALVLLAAASLIAVAATPDLALGGEGPKDGRWRGIVGSNTVFARYMALGALAVWCLRRQRWGLERYDAPVILLFLLCLWQAQAATALLAFVAALASTLLVWRHRPGGLPLWARLLILALFAVPASYLVAANYLQILDLLGRDPTLTHRVYIWQAAFERGLDQPLFGAGYRSFWIYEYASDVLFNTFGSGNTELGNGHNGYLDMWLELGLVGLGLTLALLLQNFLRVAAALRAGETDAAAFFGALLVFVLVYSVAEKVILEHSELVWLLFVAGSVSLKWRHGRGFAADPAAAGRPLARGPNVVA
jgi:exopolysaccharide production protein ExoQ